MMRIAAMPMSTRVLLGVSVASVALLGWAMAGGRGLPAATAVATASPLPVSPVAAPIGDIPSPNAADRAWSQPVFFRDRKPHVAELGGSGDANQAVVPGFDATLTGIVRSADLSMAFLKKTGQSQPIHVRLGQQVPDASGWRLVELTARTARFQSGSDEKILKLDVRRPDESAPPPPAVTPVSAPPRTDTTAATDGSTAGGAPKASAPNNNVDTPPVPPPALTHQQQIDAVRQRIEAARKAQHQSDSPAKH